MRRAHTLEEERFHAVRVHGTVAGRPGEDREPPVLRGDKGDGVALVVHELRGGQAACRQAVPGASVSQPIVEVPRGAHAATESWR